MDALHEIKSHRTDVYHKHNCHFEGKLVVVEYQEEMERDPRWGIWNGGVVFKYIALAEELVTEKYGNPKRVLLSMPEYVCELEDQNSQ